MNVRVNVTVNTRVKIDTIIILTAYLIDVGMNEMVNIKGSVNTNISVRVNAPRNGGV